MQKHITKEAEPWMAFLDDKLGNHPGYITTHYDSNFELATIPLSYDKVFDALKEDGKLLAFLSGKARNAGIENRKESFEDIQRNIEYLRIGTKSF